MQRPLRNESEQTVKLLPYPLTLIICYHSEQVCKITLKTNQTVADLLQEVKHKLGKRFHNIIGLASLQGYFTLDFALQQHHSKLAGIRNNQKLEILLEEVVAEDSGPTLADFNFLACLGEGVSAVVFLVRHIGSGQLFALKQIKKQYLRQFKTLESILREKKILAEIVAGIPYFTQLQASFESQNHLNLLLEIYPGGELFYHLTQRKLTQSEAKICFAEVLLGMEQLHKNKVLYRDLKPENIMVDFDGHLRIGDFGLCRINLEREDMAFSHCGSPEYMAYQTRDNEGYSYPADFYTMGAIIYEMVKGVPPFFNNQPLSFEDTSSAFRELVEAMIRRDPNERLCSFAEIKRSRWLKNLNWDKIRNHKEIMPTRLSLYTNYIHSEFVMKEFDWEELSAEGRYDRLFEMFNYMRSHEDGIHAYYPLARTSKRITKMRDDSRSSSKSKKGTKSPSRNISETKKSERGKSQDKKEKEDTFRKKTSKKSQMRVNVYTAALGGRNHAEKEREKADTSVKGKSNKKNNSKPKSRSKEPKEMVKTINKEPILDTRNPLKFKAMASVRSTGQLKGVQYLKQLDRSTSKRKDLKDFKH